MTAKPPMPESHFTEWKVSWKDDYLKWRCGFTNAGSQRNALTPAGQAALRADPA